MRRVVSFVTVQFRLLGPLEASEHGESVQLGGPRQRAVLAHLLIRANEVVSTDHLIDAVWGASPPPAAKGTLHSYVSRLRRAISEGATIEGRAPGYVLLVDPERIDAARFESLAAAGQRALSTNPEQARETLEEALGLWYGVPLADLDDNLELRVEAERLSDIRLHAIEDRIEALLELGRHDEVVDELESLAREHVLRERLWGQLMLALYRSGRQADALAAYQETRRHLSDELGLEPSPRLRELQGRILRQDPALEPGVSRLRGYRLLEPIGRGSFGVVYRASQPHVGRTVAVKVIQPSLANDPRFVRRFDAEAQLVARLEHPYIVPLYDYWRDPEGAYLVMRLLRGGSLEQALVEGPLRAERALAVVGQVSSALAFAHRAGIVHRDVKPANVLLDEEGNAYLSDFGIAADVADELRAPTPESSEYLSPEQERGEPGTTRTDVFGLGALLRRALAGAEVSAPVAEIISEATAEDPQARPRDADAFAAALREAAEPAAPAPQLPTRNPFKGMRAFTEADAADFFGRGALVERLVDRLQEGARFVALVGASGSGKSSVVSAGLFPALRRSVVKGSGDWLLVRMTPSSRPMERLEQALLGVSTSLRPRLRDPRQSELLLFVDQLEELFTQTDGDGRRRDFLDELAAAVADHDSRTRVVVALRADFLDRPLAHRAFAELLQAGVETVGPLSPDEVEQAVTRPAARAGARSEAGLVAALVADAAGQPSGLPLLQYALTELFDRHDGTTLTSSAYHELGGLAGAVARRADEIVEQATSAGREAIRQLFLRLVAIDPQAGAVRRRVVRSELAALDVDEGELEAAVDAFGRHRLLSFDHEPTTRAPTVEIAHEALLETWVRLAGWIATTREDLHMRERLALAAAEWEAAERDPSFLLWGARLELFDAWAPTADVVLARGERVYLQESRAQDEALRAEELERRERERELEHRSRRRLLALVAVLAAAFAVAAGLAVVALDQRQAARGEAARADEEARIATARELAASALASLDDDPERSILLALEAVDATRSPDGTVLREAEEALHEAVQASRVVMSIPATSNAERADSVAFGPDGRRVAATEFDGVALWDVGRRERVGRLLAKGTRVLGVAFSLDGRWLATVDADGAVALWNAASERRATTISAESAPTGALVFSADGSKLAVATAGFVQIWSVPEGRGLVSLGAAGATGLAFSLDGRKLAVANGSATVWDVPTGQRLLSVDEELAFDVAFAPDGSRLAVTGEGVAVIVDARTGRELISLAGHRGILTGVAMSPDGRTLVTSGHDGTVRAWDAYTGAAGLVLAGQGAAVDAVAFGHNGRRVAACCAGGRAQVWDTTATGSRELLTIAGHEGSVFNVTYSPDGQRLATASEDGTARIWDAASGRELVSLTGHVGPVADIVFSPDERRVATAGFDRTARIWDAETGDAIRLLKGHSAPLWGVSFTPDGENVATVSEDQTGRIWSAATGKLLHVLAGHRDAVYDVAYQPGGELVATVGNDFTARIWDGNAGTELRVLQGHRANIVELAYSPNGQWLATAGFDGARIWEVETGRTVAVLAGHAAAVLDVDFSPDATRVATASLDGTIKVWARTTGLELLTLSTGGAGAGRLAFSPDGDELAVGDVEGTVRVYVLDPGELATLARERVTRPLADEECRQYLHRPCGS